MCKNQLIYIAFGSKIYQIEAFLSISSAIARSRKTPEFYFDIHVYTDDPVFYKELPVQVHPIKREWYGEINYHFRVKHAVVYETAHNYENTILIDTDTFFKMSPKHLFEKITDKNLLCNSKHYFAKNNIEERVLKVLKEENLFKNDITHLNSGVIGINYKSTHILEKSIAIIDTLHPKLTDYYTLEELALALAVSLKNIESVDCIEVIHHYWSRKAIFRKKAEAWYNKHKANPTSDIALNDTFGVTNKIPKPPVIVRTLNKLIAFSVEKKYRQFVREILNANHTYKNEFDNAAATAWIDKAIVNIKQKIPSISDAEIKLLMDKKSLLIRKK